MQNLNDDHTYDPREDQEAQEQAQRLQREEALRALEELRGETVAQSAAQPEQQQTAVQPEQQSPVQTEQAQPKQAERTPSQPVKADKPDKPDTPAVADSVTERQSQHDFLVKHGVAKPVSTVSDRSVRQKTQVRAVRLADQIQANKRSTKRALSQKKDENVTKAMKM